MLQSFTGNKGLWSESNKMLFLVIHHCTIPWSIPGPARPAYIPANQPQLSWMCHVSCNSCLKQGMFLGCMFPFLGWMCLEFIFSRRKLHKMKSSLGLVWTNICYNGNYRLWLLRWREWPSQAVGPGDMGPDTRLPGDQWQWSPDSQCQCPADVAWGSAFILRSSATGAWRGDFRLLSLAWITERIVTMWACRVKASRMFEENQQDFATITDK